MSKNLDYEVLQQAVNSHAAAFRCITEYQPVGGSGDKVFPPTYKEGKYAKYAAEERVIDGQIIQCVLLDSVQSQANRMELALLESRRKKQIELPLVTVRFNQDDLLKKFTVTSLEAPHRIVDAILRDSLLVENGKKTIFRKSSKGRLLDTADVRNATGLFGLCPTALVFGIWDSTGPRGGLGAKFQRAIVSEIIGWNASVGSKTGSRIDPLQIQLAAGPLYERAEKGENTPDWTLDDKAAKMENNKPKKLSKDGKPSEANHGNITPSIAEGGWTISKATQTTVLSLTALRRLRFPLDGAMDSAPDIDRVAHTVLAALGLAAAVLVREEGADLRSRCQLFPVQEFVWELLDMPGQPPKSFTLNGDGAIELFRAAVNEAKKVNLPWENEILLTPHDELVKLVKKSQELAAHQGTEEDS
ncbi:MAG: type I-U CRISPR-associated RAMP protein Csb1/Cas7u [Chloroflexota bacterium]